MGGTVNKNDALRIGRGIQNIERLTKKNTTGLNRPVRTKTGIPAKITKVGDFGLYDLIEQQINKEGDGFEDKKPIARIWDDTGEELPQAFEINGTADLDVDLIVYIYRQSNDEVALNQWFFDSASNTGDSSTATDKSNTILKGKVQFRNDVPFNANLQGPFDFEFMAPRQVGSLTDGNRAYGGNEDGVDNFAGIQRHYKWMWYKPSVTEGYLMPGTAAFKQSVSDEVGLQFLNQMWIRMDHRFDGQVTEIHHGLCARDFFDQAGPPFPGRFSVTPAGGVQATVWASATNGGVTNIKCEFDKTGHLRKLDDTYGDEDEYPTDVNIKQTTGTYPSSSSLYNTGIDQESNLVDENNVDTNAFNGPIGTLVYTAIGTNGTPLNIGFTVSTGFSVAAAATEFNGAGTGGNNELMFWDLSKQLDGSDVTLTSLLLDKNRSSTSKITDVESVQLVTTIETTPVPDNASFDVKVELQHGIGGTQAQGTEFIRFNANGEYQVVVFLFLKDKADAFDPDDAATYLLKEIATVANQGTFSGNTVSFSFNFEDTDSGSEVCARAFLEFFKTLVNPQPLPDQIGFCDISNANNFDEDCEQIEGAVSTGIVTFANSTYNPESIGSNVTIDTFELRNINPIKVVYKIQKGGDTTEFTGLPSRFGLFLPTGVEVRISEDGITDDFSTVTLINPTDGQATDGFEITINYIEDGLISDGQSYLGKAFTDGVSNTPDEFTFTSGGGAFPVTDFFGDRSEDLPFPWSDFGAESEQQSTNTTGEPLTLRGAVTTVGTGTLSGSINSNNNAFVTNVDNSAVISSGNVFFTSNLTFLSTQRVKLKWIIEAINEAASGDHQLGILGGFLVGGDFFTMYFTRSNNSTGGPPPTGTNTTGDQWSIITNDRIGGTNNFVERVTGLSFNQIQTFSVEYDGTGTVTFDWGTGTFVASKTGSVTNLFIQNNTAGTSGNQQFECRDFTIQIDDHIGTLVNFWSPNMDRWLDTNPIGEAYQIASPATNSLEQIIPASIGLDLIRLENLFAGGTNPSIATSTWKVESNFIDMIFAGSGTETCMIEVENVALDTMRCGWRDNGTGGQKFFVDINSVEEVAEANATSSGKVTIERGDFTSNDFGGSTGFDSQKSLDIDGFLFDSRWSVLINSLNATINASSELIASSSTSADEIVIRQTLGFDDDFFMSINFKDFSAATPGEVTRGALLTARVGGVDCSIFRLIDEQGVTNGYIFEQGANRQDIEQVDASGKIAIRRVGSSLTWELNDVVKRTETQTGNVERVTLSMRHGNDSGAFTSTLFDFVLLRAGNEFLFNRVLFNNDDVLKFVFDDSNSPVTDIDIITSTTLTTAFNCTYQDIDIQAPTGTQFTFDPSL